MNLIKLTRLALLANILLSHVSYADLIDSQLDTLGSIEQSLDAEIISPDLPVIKPIQDADLPTKINTLEQKIESQHLKTLSNRLKKLPAQLNIKNKKGETQFIEVNVENGWRAVKQEWLVMLNTVELAALKQLSQSVKLNIIEQTYFSQLNTTLVRFKVDSSLDSYLALKKILPTSLLNKLDRNHIYNAQKQSPPPATEHLKPTDSKASICPAPVRVGMLDTAIELNHLAFKKSKIKQQLFLTTNIPQPKEHGSAVAALFISSAKKVPALLPNAQLYSAGVFHAQSTYAQGATVLNLIKGINWLLSQQVSVINMSLAGPDNQVLAQAISQVLKKEVAIVAAAGNQGPTAEAMYPAAYSGVISATAVDANQQIYRWANQGSYIDFAALGVAVKTVTIDETLNGFGLQTGTSMAAPVVSAFVACEKHKHPNYLAHLISLAQDLGKPGQDSVFGHGLLSINPTKSFF
ncbi:S8 family serine peptidase [Catenovulum adriaticum]|uniref:S8 family serine peptidase n=1 Tax=Catenovulum adriaticum TaxID=2984846 RepID=A0ABY7ALQ1_9ALTE|nr:S8 family serine peptidase [Catenovulum sp. TS8]WAJ70483.1 S8 family serine peptidase [Catenovulum sp. TS8]